MKNLESIPEESSDKLTFELLPRLRGYLTFELFLGEFTFTL